MEDDKARIGLSGEFTADEVEELLMGLAKLRSGMLPEVPQEPPGIDSPKELLPQPDASFRIRTRSNGGLRVWLRHAGFGWIPFELGADEAKALHEFLGKKIGHTHTSH